MIRFRVSSLLTMSLLAGSWTWSGCQQAGELRDSPPPKQVTYTRNIAPILFEHCSGCHHPSGSAPFSLLSYGDVRKRAEQIALLTATRYMPPWLPAPGYGEFLGERRMSAHQINLIQRWVQEGAAEGSPSELPAAPKRTEGWQLGKPNLVLQIPESYTLQAEGSDIFRNFVIASPLSTSRYVKAVEFRPGNPKVVHHAILLVDETLASRYRDNQDPGPGYDGMLFGEAHNPDGDFVGWTPGKVSSWGTEGLAWRLEKGADLVLQLHMLPSGKPEPIRPALGLYFADRSPRRHSFIIRLGPKMIDIPPGDKHYRIEDSYVLPVDVEVLKVYPHAHYLGKEMQGFALLPDGTKKWLIWIKDWDFNWQDEYQYARPMFLPKGSTVYMKFTYDNSSDNVRNPHHPPRRVVYGVQTTDEMGDLILQVVLRNREQLETLKNDFTPKALATDIDRFKKVLESDPGDAVTHNSLATVYLRSGDTARALAQLREAVRLQPNYAFAYFNLGQVLWSQGKATEAIRYYRVAACKAPQDFNVHYNLAVALSSQGKLPEAICSYREALRLQPKDIRANYNLAVALTEQGQLEDALVHYRKVLETEPDNFNVHYNMGIALDSLGRMREAKAHYLQALKIEPGLAKAHHNLGTAFASEGRLEQAVHHYTQALEIDPALVETQTSLGVIHQLQGRQEEALQHFQKALQLNPDFPEAHGSLASILSARGRLDEALNHYRRALEARPDWPEALMGLAWILASHPDPRQRQSREAIQLAQQACRLTGRRDPTALDTLAAVYAASGQFARAVETAHKALSLAMTAKDHKLAAHMRERLETYQKHIH